MLIKQISHIVISMLLLISTSGVIINKHYSGEELFSSTLFVEAESCCEVSCCHHEHQNNCREESTLYKLIVDYTDPGKTSPNTPVFFELVVFALPDFNASSLAQLFVNSALKFPFSSHPPPGKEFPVLFQSFLL